MKQWAKRFDIDALGNHLLKNNLLIDKKKNDCLGKQVPMMNIQNGEYILNISKIFQWLIWR